MRILVTGANGFIGRATCAELSRRGHEVVAAVRRLDSARGVACARAVAVGDIGPASIHQLGDWRAALAGVEAVVHTAAKAHAAARLGEREMAELFAVNVEGTRAIAAAAAVAGARRFVFLSTVKVLGPTTKGRFPVSETDPPNPDPRDAYAHAKAAAEASLASLAATTPLEIVVLRPPLVYGPGVGANFALLVRLARLAPPLPFARIANRRSLLFLGNLTDAIALALTHPRAGGETFLVRDGEDVSTPELIRKIAGHLARPARLFSFPPSLLRAAANALGQGARAQRLLDSLELDDRKIRDRLGWRPPYSLDRGLALALRPPESVDEPDRPHQEPSPA
jgi:nucleoside-diphosphate-sugar epimerase